jgi:Uma2 family endonuclease
MEKYDHLNVDLVLGQLKEYGMATGRHGQVCARANRLLGNFIEDNNLGHTMSNDTRILIRRDPDTVRGADVCYVSFSRLPPGPAPDEYLVVPPELCVEVRSASNTWSDIFIKVGEYIGIGVSAVLVLDPDTQTASVYRADALQQIFRIDDELTLPDVLPGFAVPVRRFFA